MASLRLFLEAAARKPKPPFWLRPTISLIALGNKIRTPFFNIRGNRKLNRLRKASAPLKIHVGCGRKGRYFPDFINCDLTPYKSADLVTDCGTLRRFSDHSIDLVFSHAFFEHLYRDQQPVFLRECRRILKEKGIAVTLSLPDFRQIAYHYLQGSEINPGEKFDRSWAYTETHGLPEGDPLCWIGQLHKNLLDREYLLDLHQKAGFREVRLFNYAHKYELLPLVIGVIASPSSIEGPTWDLVRDFSPFFLGQHGTPDRLLDETIWRA